MNVAHPAQIIPSWYRDSVGHYERDTLVIDTVGVKIGLFAMVDFYGTPYTEALHVVERYQLLDYETAKEGLERDARENLRPARGADAAPNPTTATEASTCNSVSRSRMKASSPCRGRRPSRTDAGGKNGGRLSVPRTCGNRR